jgi:sec-independent protein translocase protein TatC
MKRADDRSDPDDLFADTRMSFGEHIEDLRKYLLKAIAGFLIAFLFSFLIGERVLAFIKAPVESQLKKFHNRRLEQTKQNLEKDEKKESDANSAKRIALYFPPESIFALDRQMAKLRGQPPPNIDEKALQNLEPENLMVEVRPLDLAMAMSEADQVLHKTSQLATMSITEPFMVFIKVCTVTGFILGSPWIFYQLWAFVAAGLYPHEKRYINIYLPVSLGLFLTGAALCQFMVIPKAIEALLWFNEWLGLEPELRLNEWLGFAILLPLVFGISFQTPMVMLFLAKIGILDTDSFRQKRRMAWFVLAIFAAIVTPVDAISMLMLWIPMCGLYELGILLVQYTAKPANAGFDVPEEEEMVGV